MSHKPKLTEYGEQCVEDYIEQCEEEHRKASKEATVAFERMMQARRVRDCDHDLECLGGIERVETRCKKCGFSWMD